MAGGGGPGVGDAVYSGFVEGTRGLLSSPTKGTKGLFYDPPKERATSSARDTMATMFTAAGNSCFVRCQDGPLLSTETAQTHQSISEGPSYSPNSCCPGPTAAQNHTASAPIRGIIPGGFPPHPLACSCPHAAPGTGACLGAGRDRNSSTTSHNPNQN